MNIKNRYSWAAGFIIGIFALQGNAAESWNVANNRVTYSVFQDNFELGTLPNDGGNLWKNVSLSQLNLSQVASQEGVGTAANYALSSAVLSMNGIVYGTIYYKNNSESTVTPTFKVSGTSLLEYGSDATPDESYSRTAAIGTIAPQGEYSDTAVSIAGSATPKTVTITEDLERFLGTGTIVTRAAFPVDGYFTTGGTDFDSTVALQGKADITITYNYTYDPVPEPSSVALITLGFAALALRRKRKTV